jgi:serine/threonine protein kinase
MQLKIDQFYTYEVEDTLEGGMGYVLLMSLVSGPRQLGLTASTLERSEALQDRFRYPYRQKLAAKTIKDQSAMPRFARECTIWLGFEESGIVPLLKVVLVDGMTFALMPRYAGSLRELIVSGGESPFELLRCLQVPISGLSAVHRRCGIVHQDIKPENVLYKRDGTSLLLLLSDWGIANVQASLLPKKVTELSPAVLTTMSGFGTVPYMAPERFANYVSDVRADIFSLGIMFFEIITGDRPYDRWRSVAEQILTGEYYHTAKSALARYPQKVSRLLLSMIHPAREKRLDDYSSCLKLMKSL